MTVTTAIATCRLHYDSSPDFQSRILLAGYLTKMRTSRLKIVDRTWRANVVVMSKALASSRVYTAAVVRINGYVPSRRASRTRQRPHLFIRMAHTACHTLSALRPTTFGVVTYWFRGIHPFRCKDRDKD